jgi:MoaA/NifB/PqqE/SkfB family radical SAM enzyme
MYNTREETQMLAYAIKNYLRRYYNFIYSNMIGLITYRHSHFYNNFKINLPFFAIRNLKWIFNMILNRDMSLYLMFSLTYRCQAKCLHCSVSDYPVIQKEELTTEEVKNVINQAHRLGISTIEFFGGEPILRSDILELIEYTSQKRMLTYLDTNGLFLTKKMIKQLKNAGLKLLFVSIDSAIPHVHDRLRGVKGCFKRAVNGLKNAIKIGQPCVISTYITKERVDNGELEDVIKFGRELGVTAVRILFPMMSGRWLYNADVIPTKKQEIKIRKMIDLPFVYVEDLYKKFKECNGLLNKTFFYISPYGDVQPCFCIPLSFGNVREEPLRMIVRRMYRHPIFENDSFFSKCPTLNEIFRKKYINTISPDVKLPFRV